MNRPSRSKCPHCGGSFPIRNSLELNPVLRRVHAQCTNTECGFTAQGFFQWEFELSPSGLPNPEFSLPPSPHRIKSAQVKCV
ncbi:ogr/Delta-like zinc finger family protein [Acinetobacter silvestris]|uniref:Transcriptional regulator n=1 Tax=Acinetobacter silvestris TaxID=1977882 RepID=A0A1Y3CJ53_9GAMM|nr:ogr/Delta-like zinc finger family protein [Acinetobacter silvestris]OTG65914.1 transcriptional regulator [Acinetobacter silvestris]